MIIIVKKNNKKLYSYKKFFLGFLLHDIEEYIEQKFPYRKDARIDMKLKNVIIDL